MITASLARSLRSLRPAPAAVACACATRRRSFLAAGGLGVAQLAAGVVGAPGALAAGSAAVRGPSDPRPIPHTLELGGGLPPIHVRAPGVLGPADDEPSSITDFNGMVGYAIIDGTGRGTDTATGATKTYSTNVDLRFMVGAYVGMDGRRAIDAFGFI
jgi:hypothetical protein